ncbi:hypothetical protein GCM10010387_25980 [Streptomyces inusitatus]|uniref:Metallophosphoesterase n=1 Tax=Streptomyces inusitatus TaxID=68221 RepID=A0A918Q3H0_9ACTN|nr:SAV_2336 N-terminal domain-related protein [Streptomyces inusitatus]GGZ31031.1 hypothetical protein GCM10010387_25980 [Streptomyces inusitatus]
MPPPGDAARPSVPSVPSVPEAPLVALVARLREAELAPTAEEMADALWLARYVPPAPPAVGPPPHPTGRTADGGGEQPPPGGPEPGGAPAFPAPPAPRSRVGLYASARSAAAHGVLPDRAMRRVPVPAPAALPDGPALERSLRPLQRYRSPMRPVRRELDESATADHAADTGLVVPVLSTVRRREARIALVMDESSSNAVWGDALEELRQVCERAGAFREIAVHRIRPDDPPPTQLGDPTGRQLTLVLSDCAGPMWRSGRMQRLLHTWASTAPVAVVQPLPQRMWGRTHLPAVPGLLRRREGPAGRLEFTPGRGTPVPRGLPVPVLALRRTSFEAWTRLIAGATGQTLGAAAGIVLRRHQPATARPRHTRRVAPAERVRAFRRSASPAAAQLAVYLSAVPLTLPVMRLVQRAMLARSGPDVLAEVLLSGLLRREDPDPATAFDDDTAPSYAFLDGVREELLERLGAGSAALVLKHSSEYVESRYGRTVRNFPAMAAAFLTGSVDPRPTGPTGPDSHRLWPFAQVSAQVLRSLGGGNRPAAPPARLPSEGPAGLVARARACLAHFGEHGTVRDLDAAIRLLGSATQAERRTTERAGLYDELADALLRRWLVRPLPEDLPEALDAAQNAISGGPPRAHLTLARVLEALAEDVAGGRLSPKLVPEWAWMQAGEEPEPVAAVLLSAADAALAELTDAPPGSPGGLRESAATARIRVLRRLAVLGAPHALRGPAAPGDWFTQLMTTALGVVRLLVEAGLPDPLADLRTDERHESALLVRGALHLELARHHRGEGPVPPARQDPAAARAHAERAGDDLYTGIDGIDWDAVDQRELCRAWLDYADAIEFADERPDDDTRLRILQALDQARRNVGHDEAAQAHILLRMARLLEQRYTATGSWSHRDSAIAAWTEALPLLPRADPGRTAVLTALGRQLTERGADKDAPADVHTAVRVLRTAIAATAAADPELPRRRALLGQAYIERFRAQGRVADLHEADWALGAAARAAADPELAGYAWWYRALASALLAARTAAPEPLRTAVAHYRKAEEDGPDGLLAGAITAQWARAGRLERTAGPERALEEHRAVLALLTGAGSAAGDLIRQEVARLEP